MPERFTRTHARITFTDKGQIIINKMACFILELDPKTKYAIAQDKDNKKDWYLIEDVNGFEWSQHPKGFLIISRKYLAKTFMQSLGIEDKSVHCRITEEHCHINSMKAYQIITSSAKGRNITQTVKKGKQASES